MSSSSEPSPSPRQSEGVASTSRSLLVRLRDNESDAWDRLVTLYAPLVYFWCRKLGLAEQDTPDVAQEVFKSVTTGINRFRKDRPEDTFRGWLRTITRCKAADHYRRQSRQPAAAGGSVALRQMAEFPDAIEFPDAALPIYVDDESDDESVYHGLFLRACDLIRTDFKENTWKAFWRVVVDGQSPKDVGDELSIRTDRGRTRCRPRKEHHPS